MKTIRKIIALFLVTALLCGGMTVAAASSEEYTLERLYDEINAALLKNQATIDVKDYKLPAETVCEVYSETVNSNPLMFHCSNSYGYSVYERGGITYALAIAPNYEMTVSEYAAAAKEYEQMITVLYNRIPQELSDFEKIVFVHEYLEQNYEYDETLEIDDAYRFLKEGTGVCHSYALVFKDLMNRSGIECEVAFRQEFGGEGTAGHAWNVVKLNGKYYHVDCTYDDPTPDRLGSVHHEYLLCSDAKMIADDPNRAGWYIKGGGQLPCNDTTYDSGMVWDDSKLTCQFTYLNGSWYTLRFVGNPVYASKLCRVTGNFTGLEEVLELSDSIWMIGDTNSFLPGTYCGLFAIGDCLFGNNADTVWYYNPATDTAPHYLTGLQRDKGTVVYGAARQDGFLKYENNQLSLLEGGYVGVQRISLNRLYLPVLDAGNWATALINTRKLVFGLSAATVDPMMYDVNDDGRLNVLDLIRSKRYAAA